MARRGTWLVLVIVVLDAMGIGIAFPILPGLLRSLLPGMADVSTRYGLLLVSYAVPAFLAAPLLGSLSDRFGRRPLLLLALFGAAFDNAVVALAPGLSVLFVGRMLAGMTGASLTVTNAYVADLTPEPERAAGFGRLNACFGIGFIAGPVLGGLVGSYSLRAPFALAAGMNAVGALLCVAGLPESRARSQAVAESAWRPALNPFAALRAVASVRALQRYLYVFATIALIGETTGVLWVVDCPVRFGWGLRTVGLSLAVYGLLHALCQGLLPGMAQRRFGPRRTVLFGMASDTLGFGLFAVARSTAAASGVIPLFSLGGVGLPAMQAVLSGNIGDERQGELQGVLTGLTTLSAVVAPLFGTSVYHLLQRRLPGFPGAFWLVPVVLYLPCAALLARPARRPAVTVARQQGGAG